MAWYRALLILMAMLVVSPLSLAGSASEDNLLEGFREPPLSARPSIYWTWVNGLTNKDRMTVELEELKAKGIGGLYIFDVGAQDPQGIVPTGPAFMGVEQLELRRALGPAPVRQHGALSSADDRDRADPFERSVAHAGLAEEGPAWRRRQAGLCQERGGPGSAGAAALARARVRV